MRKGPYAGCVYLLSREGAEAQVIDEDVGVWGPEVEGPDEVGESGEVGLVGCGDDGEGRGGGEQGEGRGRGGAGLAVEEEGGAVDVWEGRDAATHNHLRGLRGERTCGVRVR